MTKLLKNFTLKHLNQEKIKYQFIITINEIKFFENGFKLKKVSEEDLISISYNRGSKRKGEIEGKIILLLS
jgi:hypothetical protein